MEFSEDYHLLIPVRHSPERVFILCFGVILALTLAAFVVWLQRQYSSISQMKPAAALPGTVEEAPFCPINQSENIIRFCYHYHRASGTGSDAAWRP